MYIKYCFTKVTFFGWPLFGNNFKRRFKYKKDTANVLTRFVEIVQAVEAGQRSKEIGLEMSPSFRKLPSLQRFPPIVCQNAHPI